MPVFVTGHHHSPQALLHVVEAVGQGQHRHDLAGHRDVKLRLKWKEKVLVSGSATWTAVSTRSRMYLSNSVLAGWGSLLDWPLSSAHVF